MKMATEGEAIFAGGEFLHYQAVVDGLVLLSAEIEGLVMGDTIFLCQGASVGV